MDPLTPKHTVSSSPSRGEISFSVTGFYELEQMEALNAELDRHAWPIVKAGKRIHVIGDMQGFVPQSRETGNAIREHLEKSQEFNLSRVAIYNATPLAKLQYKRVSAGIEVEFFDNHADALKWLRRPYDQAA